MWVQATSSEGEEEQVDMWWHQHEIKWLRRETAELLIAELIVLNLQDLSQGISGYQIKHTEGHQGRYMYEGMCRQEEEEPRQEVDVFGIEI